MGNDLKIISFDDIKMYRRFKQIEIIDLRKRQEYMRGHVDGAVNMPELSYYDLKKFSKQKTYILYCERGSLSFKMARIMAQNGFDVMTVAGGYRSLKK